MKHATVHSFPPISRADATILVLGTMPGKASLQAGQYYAHGRNVFWKIVASILGFDVSLAYEDRVSHLVEGGIALWDVLQLCTREGSLDSEIRDHVPNDFRAFFKKHGKVKRVCFNGGKAMRLFKALDGVPEGLEYVQLPSTSPANAAVAFAKKRAEWAAGLSC